MARERRIILPGLPHHLVARGNRRETLFFSDQDLRYYVGWLGQYAYRFRVQVLAYCLMKNHVHLVAVPQFQRSFAQIFGGLHTRFAMRINAVFAWTGHVWQGRYFSSPLDEAYMLTAIRYAECNPVQAGIIDRAEEHPWSSAAAHCGLQHDPLLTQSSKWVGELSSIRDWSHWLAEYDGRGASELQRTVTRNLPCGSEALIRRLERRCGRSLRVRSRGCPRSRAEQKS